ncbi:MAG: YtxH domain-containing protein [bacterium]|nr:YtxH domain-containing protein [bacterium]
MSDNQNKTSKLGLGILIGTVLGGLAAFFFSPESGPENRKKLTKKVEELKKLLEENEIDTKLKEIFGEATIEARDIYLKAKDWLVDELALLEDTIENIDEEKYIKSVEKVMSRISKEVKKDSKQLLKLKKQLLNEWAKMKK